MEKGNLPVYVFNTRVEATEPVGALSKSGCDEKKLSTLGKGYRIEETPIGFDVNQGETVRFAVINNGKLSHEFVLGTKPVLDRLAELVAKSPNEVDHDRADRLHVEPGTTGERFWNFNRAGEFTFACLFAGHYQAGMIGRVNVTPVGVKSK